eukprot:4420270-Karenia_brevis.AAC.1
MLEQSMAFATMRSNVQEVKTQVSSLENSQSKSFERLEALILQTRAPDPRPHTAHRSRAVTGPRVEAKGSVDTEREMGDALDEITGPH